MFFFVINDGKLRVFGFWIIVPKHMAHEIFVTRNSTIRWYKMFNPQDIYVKPQSSLVRKSLMKAADYSLQKPPLDNQ